MSEERKKIVIGSEYRDTYANLVKLLRSGYLSGTGARVETDESGRQVIRTDAADYIYEERSGSTGGANVTLSMGKSGASWFEPVRHGKAFDDGTSEWKQLIYKVARDFHNACSIIEYKRCDGSGKADDAATESNIRALITRLFDRTDAVIIKGKDRSKGSEDIYGASVKLELSGTGQTHYVVMCKIFFRRTSDGISPLSRLEAEQINARLEDAPDNDEPIKLTAAESANINNTTVNAVRDLIAGKYVIGFKEALCFSTRQVVNPDTGKTEDNYDLKTYKALAARARANDAHVTCTSVQVLGISHVEWINDYYEIALGGKLCLQAIVGFGGSLTLRCTNCNGGNLVTSNVISYKVTDENGFTRSVNKPLDYSVPDLGITDVEFGEIKKYSEFANHLLTVKCKNPRVGKQCISCVCRSQTIYIDGEMKCADCPYPEVVYTDYSGDSPIRYLTGRMVFACDKLAMVLKENAGTCVRCGRTFTAESLTGGQCKLCSGVSRLSGEERETARRLYTKYRNAFPHTVRARHAFDEKLCLEDDTALVFALGSETYVLSKLDILSDSGFLTQPKLIK